MTPTVLVLRALGLGDFVTGLPALAMLRAALPDHRIVLVAPRVVAPLAELTGSVDDVVHGHELEPFPDAPSDADLAVDLHGNGPESRQLLLEHRPRRLIAFGPGGSRWEPDEHEVMRWCRLVAEGLGLGQERYPGVAGRLAEPLVDVPARRTIIHPGAASSSRRWPADRFVQVARSLRQQGHAVAITGGPHEQLLAAQVAAGSGADLTATLDLPELVGLVARARLVVSGDTGIAHVASAFGTPSVLLFGPVSPLVWGPPADGPHEVLWHGDGRGDPHGPQPDPALLRITVDEVLAACGRWPALDERAGAGR